MPSQQPSRKIRVPHRTIYISSQDCSIQKIRQHFHTFLCFRRIKQKMFFKKKILIFKILSLIFKKKKKKKKKRKVGMLFSLKFSICWQLCFGLILLLLFFLSEKWSRNFKFTWKGQRFLVRIGRIKDSIFCLCEKQKGGTFCG